MPVHLVDNHGSDERGSSYLNGWVSDVENLASARLRLSILRNNDDDNAAEPGIVKSPI